MNYNKKAVHFGFSEVNFEKIISRLKTQNQSAVLSIAANMIELEEVNLQKCSELFLSLVQKGDFVNIEVQKQINDEKLLTILQVIQEMNPEELCITVSSGTETEHIYWDIIVLYYEDVVTICYDRSVRKRDVVNLFSDCFK